MLIKVKHVKSGDYIVLTWHARDFFGIVIMVERFLRKFSESRQINCVVLKLLWHTVSGSSNVDKFILEENTECKKLFGFGAFHDDENT